MFGKKKKKDPGAAIILSGIGFVAGLGAVFLFGTKRGEKYRKQIGEFTADFLDSIAESCDEIKKSLSR